MDTNNLQSEVSSEKIAKSIMNLATRMKSTENDIMASRLKEKAESVNEHIMNYCIENDICYLDNKQYLRRESREGMGMGWTST